MGIDFYRKLPMTVKKVHRDGLAEQLGVKAGWRLVKIEGQVKQGKESAQKRVSLEVENNPFGDYAPQSTQIQGILKGMYDAFTGDLEQANAEESGEQKSFEQLMATKKAELATLQATHERHTLDKAEKTKQEASNQQARDDEEAQLEARSG